MYGHVNVQIYELHGTHYIKIYELHGTHYIKITNFRFNNFPHPRKSCRLCDKVDKYVPAKQTTDAYIIRRRRFFKPDK